MPLLRIATLVALITSTARAAEPPAIDRLFPPGGQRGTELQVALTGKPGDGNLQVWSSHQQLSFSFAENNDKATISIPADAASGIHWLRFYNQHGCTPLRPFFVGQLAELTEANPNGQPSEAQPVESPSATINGVLEKSGDVDVYAIDLNAGESLVASLQANRELGSPMDGVLQLLDPRGTVIASNDDELGFDPLVSATATVTGTHYARLFAFPAAPNSTIRLAGAADYVYRLTLTNGSFSDHCTIEHLTLSESPGNQSPLGVPGTLTGNLDEPGQKDQFFFAAAKGQNLKIKVEAQAFFSPLDPVVTLADPAGKLIKEFDDRGGNDRDADFDIPIPDDGQYSITIDDRYGRGGSRFVYRLTIDQNKPHFKSSVAQNAYVLSKAKPLEIPVAIARAYGFAERVTVSIEGLPQGVTAAPVTSEKEGDSSKTVTLKLECNESAGEFSGVIRIQCVCDATEQSESATAAMPHSKETIGELWLTVTP